jgi:hypothetical protein
MFRGDDTHFKPMDTHEVVKPIHPIDVGVISPDHRTQTHKSSALLNSYQVLVC